MTNVVRLELDSRTRIFDRLFKVTSRNRSVRCEGNVKVSRSRRLALDRALKERERVRKP
jgi:hypothetical protein